MDATQASDTGCAEIVVRNLPAVEALCRRFGVRRLDLFGSAATGKFDPARSDLDFLIEFDPMPARRYASACFGLRDELENLFGRSVDLITEPALVNPYLRKEIGSEKRALFPLPR